MHDLSFSRLETPTQVIIERGFIGKWWNPLPKPIQDIIIGKSWNKECPIPLQDLAYINVTHWLSKDDLATGELIFHKNLAREITEIFLELFLMHFPIYKMKLIDHYDADDEQSMADNNTSAFCSRAITGKEGVFSLHSYGGTIDINPKFNPYVKDKIALPNGSEPYLDRTLNIPGLIKVGNACYNAFKNRGYSWGGHWSSLKDYQHFEKEPEKFI